MDGITSTKRSQRVLVDLNKRDMNSIIMQDQTGKWYEYIEGCGGCEIKGMTKEEIDALSN